MNASPELKPLTLQRLPLKYRLYYCLHHALTVLGPHIILKKHPFIILRNWFNRVMFKLILTDNRKCIISMKDGFLIKVPLSDQAAASIMLEREYSPHESLTLKRLLPYCYAFVDVGANLGYFSLMAASKVSKEFTILAIEPNSELCNLIIESLDLNGFHNIKVINAAAGKCCGLGKISIDPRLSSNSIFHPVEVSADSDMIDMFKIDDLIENEYSRNRFLIKIDVEGMELDVLKGCAKAMNNGAIFMCEVHQIALPELGEILVEFNYKILSYDGSVLVANDIRNKKRNDVLLVPCDSLEVIFGLLNRY